MSIVGCCSSGNFLMIFFDEAICRNWTMLVIKCETDQASPRYGLTFFAIFLVVFFFLVVIVDFSHFVNEGIESSFWRAWLREGRAKGLVGWERGWCMWSHKEHNSHYRLHFLRLLLLLLRLRMFPLPPRVLQCRLRRLIFCAPLFSWIRCEREGQIDWNLNSFFFIGNLVWQCPMDYIGCLQKLDYVSDVTVTVTWIALKLIVALCLCLCLCLCLLLAHSHRSQCLLNIHHGQCLPFSLCYAVTHYRFSPCF